MNKTTNSIDLEMLERVNQPLSGSFDTSVLQDAKQYSVDLETLENPLNITEYEQMPTVEAPQKEETYFWNELDVNLKDMVNMFFETSERIIIMVSDDKTVYLNPIAQHVLEINSIKSINNDPFLMLVDKDDWNLLTSNIGEMLTSGKKQQIRLRSSKGKVISTELQAIYLPDPNNFSFILVGNHQNKSNAVLFNNLYDDLTGLPNFFLFEDRVQMAVNNENYKDPRLPKNLIAVVGVAIDNIEMFRKLRLEEFAIKKLANTLVLSLNKAYTIARGLKYPFWILMPNIASGYDLETELKKIMAIFQDGVSDNFTTHELVVSVGVSVFPTPARSAKKLMEQSIDALKEAQADSQSKMVRFGKK